MSSIAYRADASDPTYSFALAANASLVCGTVRYTDPNVGYRRPLVQPPDYSVQGTDVRPGISSSITFYGLHMVCFVLRPGSQTVSVIGSYGDNTGVVTQAEHETTA